MNRNSCFDLEMNVISQMGVLHYFFNREGLGNGWLHGSFIFFIHQS